MSWGKSGRFGGLALSLAFMIVSLFQAAASESPYPPDAPWPVMRGDLQNSGYAKFMDWAPDPAGPAKPVRFSTGNGIFSTPVMDGKERIYVGSADHFFYAFDPLAGKRLWKFDARELIDSAAALSQDGRIYLPAGAAIYALDQGGQKIWAFDVTNHRPEGLYTFGTNYWWEGNVVIGPDGNLYAGNNDFFYYSLRPDGTLRWAYRTGFLNWSAPAFGPDGSLFFAGFDMRLYSLDRETGKRRWKTNLHNPLVASPALGPDGVIYQGSFDGTLYALDAKSGKIRWKLATDGHVYASAALDRQGKVYVTSTDGFLYAVDGRSGEVRWTFYTGDAVRSSPALGPDPEGKAEYLVYFGGGQGEVFALEPSGNRRWSFDTLSLAGRADYPNLNASPALGRHGIAVANANGDVFYVPYDYYLRQDAAGVTRDPTEGFREEGARWHRVAPGGLIDRTPLGRADSPQALTIHPAEVVILRLVVREEGRIARAKLDAESVRAEVIPAGKIRLEVFGDNRTVAIIPDEMLRPGGEYHLKVSARYLMPDGADENMEGVLKLKVPEASGGNALLAQGHSGFVITHMSFPQPPIVPSLDQIGIAIMRIPFAVVEADREKKTFLAWAVQKYGESAGGEEQGLADSRTLFYAFSGRVEGGFFALESENCFFEESSFPFPLDRFRLSGRLSADGAVERGASLLAELDPPNMLRALTRLSVSSEESETGQQSMASTLSGGGVAGFLKAAAVTGPTVAGYISHRIWRPWDLYNQRGHFIAAGTFRMEPLPAAALAEPQGMKVRKFEFDRKHQEMVAEVEATDPAAAAVMVGILLKDNATGKPAPINYNLALRRQRLADGTKRTTLILPDRKLYPGGLTAYLMADLYLLDQKSVE